MRKREFEYTVKSDSSPLLVRSVGQAEGRTVGGQVGVWSDGRWLQLLRRRAVPLRTTSPVTSEDGVGEGYRRLVGDRSRAKT